MEIYLFKLKDNDKLVIGQYSTKNKINVEIDPASYDEKFYIESARHIHESYDIEYEVEWAKCIFNPHPYGIEHVINCPQLTEKLNVGRTIAVNFFRPIDGKETALKLGEYII